MGMFIEGRRIKNFGDIQRNFMFEVSFMNAHAKKFITGWDSEDLTFRARSCVLPQRGVDAIESNFGAMKQFFPGKPTFSNSTQIQFEETESGGVGIFLYNWAQRIFDVTKGHSNVSRKRMDTDTNVGDGGIVDIIRVTPKRYNGDLYESSVYFYNAWLQQVDDVSMDYTGSEAVKYNATFQFDFWLMGKTGETPAIGQAIAAPQPNFID